MKKRILVVMAHPDDETFGVGGTIAKYARSGVDIYLVCVTKGEAGEVDQKYLDNNLSIAELRVQELECAAKKLGIKKIYYMGYRDSGMLKSKDNKHPNAFIQIPLQKSAEEIARYIRKIKPQVLITFDPMGGYGHPDHIQTYRAVEKGLEMAKDGEIIIDNLVEFSPPRIFLHTFSRKFMRIVVKIMPLFGRDPSRFGKNEDINFLEILENDYPINARVNYRKYAKVREEASNCYKSQGGDQHSGYVISWIQRMFYSKEEFMQYYPVVNTRKIIKDLFDGLD